MRHAFKIIYPFQSSRGSCSMKREKIKWRTCCCWIIIHLGSIHLGSIHLGSSSMSALSLSSLQRMESREKMGPMNFSDNHVSLYNEYTQSLTNDVSNWYYQFVTAGNIDVNDSGYRFILSIRFFRVWPILASGSSTSKSSILNQSG